MNADELRELYLRWLPGMWNAEPDAMDELAGQLFTPDVVGHWPSGEIRGPAGIADNVRRAVTMFDDVRVTLELGPIADGDLVAAKWTFAGTYRGDMPGAAAPAGTAIRFSGTDILRVEDGRFAEYWPQGDDLGLLRQVEAVTFNAG